MFLRQDESTFMSDIVTVSQIVVVLMKPLLFVQYTYSAPVEEYNAMVYVKRRDTFHVDSSPDLYGEVKVVSLKVTLDCN